MKKKQQKQTLNLGNVSTREAPVCTGAFLNIGMLYSGGGATYICSGNGYSTIYSEILTCQKQKE